MTIRDWNEAEAPAERKAPIQTDEALNLTPQRLVELYADDVWRFVSSKLRNREDAEDAAMEVFASAVRDLNRLRKGSSPRLWLLGIARNKVADSLRGKYRKTETPLNDAAAIAGPAPFERDEVYDALDGLSEIQREVLVLKYVNGLSTEEVATVIRKSPQAANSLLQRARQSLRERVQPLIDARGGLR